MENSRPALFFGATSAIARVTLGHLLRDPAILLVIGGGLLLTISAPAYMVFQFGELGKVLVDAGLSTVLVAGLLIAILGPVRAFAYELEDRTALSLLSKPVSRLSLVAGKWLGVVGAAVGAGAPIVLILLYVVRIGEAAEDDIAGPLLERLAPWMALAAGLTALAIILATWLAPRARLLAGWLAFMVSGTAGVLAVGPAKEWALGVPGGALLVFLEVAVVAAVATAAATRLGAMGTLAAGLAAVVAGHARALAEPGAGIGSWLGFIPALEGLNGVDAAAAGQMVGLAVLAWAALYALLFSAAALLAGTALLAGREVA